MDKLRKTYAAIKEILGDNTEPLDSVELVEAYRQYFKPKKVRFLLLAESHVFTNDFERQISLQSVPGLEGYPLGMQDKVFGSAEDGYIYVPEVEQLP